MEDLVYVGHGVRLCIHELNRKVSTVYLRNARLIVSSNYFLDVREVVIIPSAQLKT